MYKIEKTTIINACLIYLLLILLQDLLLNLYVFLFLSLAWFFRDTITAKKGSKKEKEKRNCCHHSSIYCIVYHIKL